MPGCLQDGGPAKDILLAVTDECRSRLQEYQAAEKRARGGAAAPRRRQPRAGQPAAGVVPALPPPPFTPADAAMLLTGLAQQRLRVGGVVEPLLQQCEAQLEAASADDVARILVALGDLLMQVGEPRWMVLLAFLLCWLLCWLGSYVARLHTWVHTWKRHFDSIVALSRHAWRQGCGSGALHRGQGEGRRGVARTGPAPPAPGKPLCGPAAGLSMLTVRIPAPLPPPQC